MQTKAQPKSSQQITVPSSKCCKSSQSGWWPKPCKGCSINTHKAVHCHQLHSGMSQKQPPPSLPWCKSIDMRFWLLVTGYYYQPGPLLDQTLLYVHHIRCNLSSQPFDSSTMPYMHPTFNVNNQPSLAKVLCSHSVWQVSPATAKITITTHNISIRGTTRLC